MFISFADKRQKKEKIIIARCEVKKTEQKSVPCCANQLYLDRKKLVDGHNILSNLGYFNCRKLKEHLDNKA